MKLTEITRPQTQKDADRIIRKAGYKRIGHGSFGAVYQKKPDQVLKTFSREDTAYLAFVRMIAKSNNPHFPKVFGNPLRVNENYYVIKQEMLADAEQKIDISVVIAIKIYLYKLLQNKTVPENSPLFDKIKKYAPNYQKFDEACQLIVGLAKADSDIGVDIHIGNVMMRNNTVVFVDPVASENALLAPDLPKIHQWSTGQPALTENEIPNTIDGKPTRNSLGKLIHPTEEGIRNFWKWFGDSKVVDAQGRPLVVYHGTGADFSEFDVSKANPANRFGPGFYFTGDKRTFDTYAGGSAGNVMPVYLHIQNPVTGNALSEQQVKDFFAALKDKVFSNGYDATQDHVRFEQLALEDTTRAFSTLLSAQTGYISAADWMRGMDAMGFDGVVRDVFGSPEFVAFRPTQIKSATGNNGNFSPKSKIITELGFARKLGEPILSHKKIIERATEDKSMQKDLFPDEFTTKKDTVSRKIKGSSSGDTEIINLPNENSLGKQISMTKQGLQNFWRWFNDSVATDKNNRPLVMFHGTNKDFSKFKTKLKTTNSYGLLGTVETYRNAIFVTPNLEYAHEYIDKEQQGANIISVYAKAENPFDLRNGYSQAQYDELQSVGYNPRHLFNIQNYWELFDEEGGKHFVTALKRLGYDSSVIYEDSEKGLAEVWVLFYGNQLKSSIGNVGTYGKSDQITEGKR